jgi:flagellar motility protein MotE (MotC chaperone)
MELTAEQIAELQRKAAEAEDLKQQLAALNGNKDTILTEKKKVADELKELRDKEAERVRKDLEKRGEFEQLLKQANDNIEALRKENEEKDKAILEADTKRVEDRKRADFFAVFNAAEVFHPEHAWALLHSLVQDKNGKTIAVLDGLEIGVADFAGKLRKNPQYAYLFKPQPGGGGMGSRPATGASGATGGAAVANPWLPGGSVTARVAIQVEDPDLAAKLKAEAEAIIASRGQG